MFHCHRTSTRELVYQSFPVLSKLLFRPQGPPLFIAKAWFGLNTTSKDKIHVAETWLSVSNFILIHPKAGDIFYQRFLKHQRSVLANVRSVSQSAVSSLFVTTLAQLLSCCCAFHRVTNRCFVVSCLSECDISSPAAMSGIQTEQSHLSRQSPGSSFLHEALKISAKRRVEEETTFTTLLSVLLTSLKSTAPPPPRIMRSCGQVKHQ